MAPILKADLPAPATDVAATRKRDMTRVEAAQYITDYHSRPVEGEVHSGNG